jgi:phage shock protein PspC (stress-responsive transcriptional regulator)
LRRNLARRWLGGVASGLSDYFGIDVNLIRLLFVLGIVFSGGTALFLYLIGWAIIPKGAQYGVTVPVAPRHGIIWVLAVAALIIAGFSLIDEPRNVIGAGVICLIGLAIWRRSRRRGSWRTRKEFDKARLAWQRRLDEQRAQSASPTYLGGDPFQINSFYPATPDYPGGYAGPGGPRGHHNPPPQVDSDPDNNLGSGFQTQ